MGNLACQILVANHYQGLELAFLEEEESKGGPFLLVARVSQIEPISTLNHILIDPISMSELALADPAIRPKPSLAEGITNPFKSAFAIADPTKKIED